MPKQNNKPTNQQPINPEFVKAVMKQAELLSESLNKAMVHHSITNPNARPQEVYGAWVINQLAETHVHIQQLNSNLNSIIEMMVNAGVIEVKMLGEEDVEVGTDVPLTDSVPEFKNGI